MKHGTLVLVRHGESRLNELNRFTGWLDIPLSEKGLEEARNVAEHCRQYTYHAAFTSHLERAHQTLLLILSHQKKIGVFEHERDTRYNRIKKAPKDFVRMTIPILNSRELNERHYGELQGLNKHSAARKFGAKKVHGWRRGFIDRPPGGESLQDVYQRVTRYFKKHIKPRLEANETLLVAAHGNTLRALIKFLERIEDDQIPYVDLPTGHPLVYTAKDNIYTRIEGSYDFNRPLR